MQADMYANFIRHVRIAGTYGEPIHSECGMGLGCCLSLLAGQRDGCNQVPDAAAQSAGSRTARLLLTTARCIDDRTLGAGDVRQLGKAIEEVVKMDQRKGHNTNVDKSKVLATTRGTRRQARAMVVGVLQLNLVQEFKLLGRRCVAAHKFTTQTQKMPQKKPV